MLTNRIYNFSYVRILPAVHTFLCKERTSGSILRFDIEFSKVAGYKYACIAALEYMREHIAQMPVLPVSIPSTASKAIPPIDELDYTFTSDNYRAVQAIAGQISPLRPALDEGYPNTRVETGVHICGGKSEDATADTSSVLHRHKLTDPGWLDISLDCLN
jgi:hypothetical protein